MVKKIVLITAFFGLVSCFTAKNEFKMPRFSSTALSSYKEKCILKDSSEVMKGFYKLTIEKANDKSLYSEGVRENYLVFYNNGKVGRYLDYKSENFDFNPKKAEMGFYGKKKGKFFMKSKVKFQGTYNLIEDEIIFLNKDSLIIKKKLGAPVGDFYIKYIKVHTKNAIGKNNPDW